MQFGAINLRYVAVPGSGASYLQRLPPCGTQIASPLDDNHPTNPM